MKWQILLVGLLLLSSCVWEVNDEHVFLAAEFLVNISNAVGYINNSQICSLNNSCITVFQDDLLASNNTWSGENTYLGTVRVTNTELLSVNNSFVVFNTDGSIALNASGGASAGTGQTVFDHNVGVGTEAPDRQLEVEKDTGATLGLRRADLSMVSNDLIGQIEFVGDDGGQNKLGGIIKAESDGTWSSNDFPTRLSLWTTPDGENTPLERLTIKSTGRVGINTITSSSTLEVNGTLNIGGVGTATPSNTQVLIESTRDEVLHLKTTGGSTRLKIEATAASDPHIEFKDPDHNWRIRSDSSEDDFEIQFDGADVIDIHSNKTVDFKESITIPSGKFVRFGKGDVRMYGDNNDLLTLVTANAERLRVGAEGFIGVNTGVDSNTWLEIQGSTSTADIPATEFGALYVKEQNDETVLLLERFDGTTSTIRAGSIIFRGTHSTGDHKDVTEAIKISYFPEVINNVANNAQFGMALFTKPTGTTTLSEVMRLTGEGKVGINTTTPNTEFNVVGDSNFTGDIEHNEHYGEMFIDSLVGKEVNFSTSNETMNVTDMTTTLLEGITNSNGVLTITKTSVYKVTHAESFTGGANIEYAFSVGINGVKQDKCDAHRVIGTGSDIGNSGASCLLSLTTNDDITFMTTNEESSVSVSIEHANFNIIEIS